MTAGTHVLAAISVAAIFNLPAIPAVAGSILPDVDLKKGLPFPPKRTLFNSHRGITHHVAIPILLFFIAIWIKDFVNLQLGIYLLSFTLGYASHLLLDSLNPLGIPYTTKYYPRFSLKLMKSGRTGEIFVILLLVSFLIFLVNQGKLGFETLFSGEILKAIKNLTKEVAG
ncbi:metal-dependent hydrolase [Phorcysia thermohydrogeniphila]|uniref:Inner membrane protein n=1 Tax=Phorcysia thermohydrogeniphila TaxID=936138 RepID=A0A4R1GCN6_9BACT|nr:metal-dependent hydrolase [Phorcysia thermohydrogeniphila]TCK04511.1 inner membrane protein [Phorcysia thermohydrogeniphila]